MEAQNMSEAEAIAALQQATGQAPEAPAGQPVAPAPTTQAAESAVPPVVGEGTTPAAPQAPAQQVPPVAQPAEDSFELRGVDPNSLPPELQSAYWNMRSAYLEKTNALAEDRRKIEALGGDLDYASRAVNILRGIDSGDPQFLSNFHQSLVSYAQERGISLAQAQAEVAQAQAQAPAAGTGEELGFVDPEIQSVKQELEEMRAWRKQQEEQAYLSQIEAELEREEAAIKAVHPDWTEFDIENVRGISYALDGNLQLAAERYASIRQQNVAAYVQEKASVPAGASTPPQGPYAEAPEQPISDMRTAREAGIADLMALGTPR